MGSCCCYWNDAKTLDCSTRLLRISGLDLLQAYRSLWPYHRPTEWSHQIDRRHLVSVHILQIRVHQGHPSLPVSPPPPMSPSRWDARPTSSIKEPPKHNRRQRDPEGWSIRLPRHSSSLAYVSSHPVLIYDRWRETENGLHLTGKVLKTERLVCSESRSFNAIVRKKEGEQSAAPPPFAFQRNVGALVGWLHKITTIYSDSEIRRLLSV